MESDQTTDLVARKRALRGELLALRVELPAETRGISSRTAAWHALSSLPWRERPRVALFWPLEGEIDTLPVLHALHWLGATPLLPRMQGKGRPLVFHAWDPDLPLIQGSFRVLEPPPGLPVVVPEIVLTPLLAFDGAGNRLGYGAGFYDMTFAAIAIAGGDPLRAGYCFACQEVSSVPADATDVPLHLVITEAGPRRLGRAES
ncbi:MAG: 5-formyltetrahydrofolate cyclo-ligase [Geminicoccaceae bacterium]